MILQSLAAYYDRLVEQGKLDKPGWQRLNVQFALQIEQGGQLIRIVPLGEYNNKGKLIPRKMNLPAQANKTSGIVRNFLCENATYMLGLNKEHDAEWTKQRYEACKEFHKKLLGPITTDAAQAVVNFFERWEPEKAQKCDALKPFWDEIIVNPNFIFIFDDQFIQNYPEIQHAWDDYYAEHNEAVYMRCMVTGEYAPIARTHPFIHGIMGGKAKMSLVSFNELAYESFGKQKQQGFNAPVSERAAFAYSEALNWMIAEKGHHIRLSDMTIVFWAGSGMDAYAVMCANLLEDDKSISDDDLYSAMITLATGRKALWDEAELNPDERFYILGLSPNAARLSVRFFLQSTFGDFAKNLLRHHERLEIERPKFDLRESLSFQDLLDETKRLKKDEPPPLLAGALLRVVLTGAQYPEMLFREIEMRIRADHKVTRGRAAIIKAYLIRNTGRKDDYKKYKEAVENVNLDENTTYTPYLLGRLFAVLEDLQKESAKSTTSARPTTPNTTIKDRYFNSACAMPVVVFPQLLKLAQAHLKKLKNIERPHRNYDRLIGEILFQIREDYPARLDLRDQSIFQLGYYHQTQSFYKREEKNNV